MRDRFLRLIAGLSQGVHERDEALKLGLLALLAGESLFLLGPPGTAKSLLARRLKTALEGARAFEYLMGRFSTPEEIFGPLSIAGLRDRDVFERRTSGYLPEADVAFLDEVWRASPPIQNTLLTILNEKRFRNGDHELNVPLKLLVAASNRAPAGEENAEAFWDRFLLRLEVGPLSTEEGFRGLVTDTSDLYGSKPHQNDVLKKVEWEALQLGIDLVELPEHIVQSLQMLRAALENHQPQVPVSDRRWKKAARLLRASAVVHGRAYVDGQDLGVLEHVLWGRPDQKDVVSRLLAQTLEEQGWPGPVDVTVFEEEVEALKEGLRALTIQQSTVLRAKPVLQDGEYFSILGYPGDLSARIWAPDFALLKSDEDLEGELFFFTPYGPFRHSEKHLLRATGAPAEVDIDGRLFALESKPEEVTVHTRIAPDGPRLKEWERKGADLATRLRQARELVDQEASSKKAEGGLHLFGAAYGAACARGLERDSADLGELGVSVETLVETRDPD